MTRHRPYRPQPSQIPADSLRGNPCDSRDPRRCVPPLKGLREPRAASVSYRASVPAGHGDCGVSPSYRASSPTGESLPLRITATHPVAPKPIMNYESCIVHCFTFSAKERDQETGYSYFGSRYYNSDLGIWLSVDPMSDKYPSMSPYVYCANNPIKLVDPNGEFPIKIHKELVSKAFAGQLCEKTLSKIQYGNGIKADIFHMFRSATHMDNMKGTKSIVEAYQKAMSDFHSNMQAGNYVDAGENLHTIADFYSHSNYVELYYGYAEENGLSTDAEDIRPFSEMMNDEKFMEYVDGKKDGLRTGVFPGLGKNSHRQMNNDKKIQLMEGNLTTKKIILLDRQNTMRPEMQHNKN